MAITFKGTKPPACTVEACSLQDGRAYLDEYGNLFIGNKYDEVIASSVCGEIVVFKHQNKYFREVNIEITVTEM